MQQKLSKFMPSSKFIQLENFFSTTFSHSPRLRSGYREKDLILNENTLVPLPALARERVALENSQQVRMSLGEGL